MAVPAGASAGLGRRTLGRLGGRVLAAVRRTYSLRAEMAILALVVLVWQAARIPLAGSVALSLDHAQDWLAAERAFGLSIEPSVVRFVDEHGLRHASELFYANLHDAVFFGFFAAARLLAPLRYPTLRTAFVVAHVPALAILGAYPLAPPRWLPAAPWLGEPPLHTAVLRNETAAAVSLHVGIPVLMAGFALWVWPRSPLAWLLLAAFDPSATYQTRIPSSWTLDNFTAVLTPQTTFIPIMNSVALAGLTASQIASATVTMTIDDVVGTFGPGATFDGTASSPIAVYHYAGNGTVTTADFAPPGLTQISRNHHRPLKTSPELASHPRRGSAPR